MKKKQTYLQNYTPMNKYTITMREVIKKIPLKVPGKKKATEKPD